MISADPDPGEDVLALSAMPATAARRWFDGLPAKTNYGLGVLTARTPLGFSFTKHPDAPSAQIAPGILHNMAYARSIQ